MPRRGENWKAAILAILRQNPEPRSAYDILGELQQTHPKVAPPTVYRALSYLKDHGQIHRLESLNAYIACQCAGHEQTAILSICDDCGCVEEKFAPDLLNQLSSLIKESGFAPQRHVIEVHGTCGACGPTAGQGHLTA